MRSAPIRASAMPFADVWNFRYKTVTYGIFPLTRPILSKPRRRLIAGSVRPFTAQPFGICDTGAHRVALRPLPGRDPSPHRP